MGLHASRNRLISNTFSERVRVSKVPTRSLRRACRLSLKKHGHCNVPRNTPKLKLGSWVQAQRQLLVASSWKQSIANDHLRVRGGNLGFEWDSQVPLGGPFEQAYDYRKTGQCVPWELQRKPKLANWVLKQRQYRHLREEIIYDASQSRVEACRMEWDMQRRLGRLH
jgi:hypothetical protein